MPQKGNGGNKGQPNREAIPNRNSSLSQKVGPELAIS